MAQNRSSYPMMIHDLLRKYPHAPLVHIEQPLDARDFADQKSKQEAYPIEGAAIGVITTPANTVLLTQRTRPFRGWALPGGRVEQGEAFDKAFRREVLEECGIEVTITDLVLIEEKVFLSSEQTPLPFWLAVFRGQTVPGQTPYKTEEARKEGLEIEVFALNQLPEEMILHDKAKVEAYFHLSRVLERSERVRG